MASMSLKKLQRSLQSAKNSTARMRKKAREGVETLLRTGEVCGTSFVFGVVKGRSGSDPKIGGVPVDLGLGIGGHALAMLGIGGGMENHLRGLADGALASFATTQGLGIGAGMARRASATAKPAAQVSGYPTPEISGYGDEDEMVSGYDDEMVSGGYALTEEDLEEAGL